MRTLEKLTIRNFKSIREQTLDLGRLNVFIGANGAGKSNLIASFRFLSEVISANLAQHIRVRGGADKLLYFGRKRSNEMEFSLEFGEDTNTNKYQLVLNSTDDDSLFVAREKVHYHDKRHHADPSCHTIASDTAESKLRLDSHISARRATEDLDGCRVYHFHDTSDTAAVKGTSKIDDNRYLRPQAENLAAFLYWMQKKHPSQFDLVECTIRQVAPFFEGFRLEHSRLNEETIRLEWKEVGNDAYFNASSLSDGTLRFICLATLLLQPDLPATVLLDEPELGLHPAALTLLAGLLSSAASRTQVIVATQSVTLVNQFEPEDVWTVDREDSQSVFRRLSAESTDGWLEDYSLGELWEKNRLGARP